MVAEEVDARGKVGRCWDGVEVGEVGEGCGVAEEAVVEIGAFEQEVDQGVEGMPDEEETDLGGGGAREEREGCEVGGKQDCDRGEEGVDCGGADEGGRFCGHREYAILRVSMVEL